MKKILLTIFCVVALLFGLIGNVFASDCAWYTETNGCEYGVCVDSGGKYCVHCCNGHNPGSICTAANCNAEPTNNADDAQLAAAIAAHNAKCANLQAGTPLATECEQEAAALQARIAASKK
jgi:hypothetical protein